MSIYSALFAGVSGLNAQSTAMASVADNITNINTVGYKSADAQFRSLVSGSKSAATYSAGGVTAVTHALVSKQGVLTASGSTTDLGIDGAGFFVTRDGPGADANVAYTRAGSFTPDKTGYLKNASGYFLQGWPLDAQGGYPNMVSGPSRTQRKDLVGSSRMPGPYKWKKGELGLHIAGSGLAIVSAFPILETQSEPFGRRRCAGLDCLSNKGMLYARIAIPGVPGTINLFNTHLNSQRASRVSPQRHARAHRLQVEELGNFITAVGSPDVPTVLGGDFNMRRSAIRFERFRNVTEPFEIVHEWCVDQPLRCDTRISWDGDEPWMDTQDLQLFESGADVQIVPIRVEALFDGSAGSPKLSDHDAFRVTYRVSWNRQGQGRPATAKRPPS